MRIDELRVLVDERAKRRSAYSVDEGLVDDALIIERVHGRFVVYYYERGSRSFEKWFACEEDAVTYFLKKFESSERWA